MISPGSTKLQRVEFWLTVLCYMWCIYKFTERGTIAKQFLTRRKDQMKAADGLRMTIFQYDYFSITNTWVFTLRIWLTVLAAVDMTLCSTSLYSVLVGFRGTCLKDSDAAIGSHDFGSWQSVNREQFTAHITEISQSKCMLVFWCLDDV